MSYLSYDRLVVILCVVRIHQVRSYGNNIAVNVWWKHDYLSDNLNSQSVDHVQPVDINIDPTECLHRHRDNGADVIDLSLTLDKIRLHGDDNVVHSLRLLLLLVQAILAIPTHFFIVWSVCLSSVTLGHPA